MSDSRELCFKAATELARLIRNREVSVRQVMAAHLAQIEGRYRQEIDLLQFAFAFEQATRVAGRRPEVAGGCHAPDPRPH